MDFGLGGRTALVLGASSGLGLASAEALREEGANVVMLARREETLREQAERLGATAVPGDVRERADLLRAVETAVRTHGGLDVLVLNGGGPAAGTAQDTDEDAVRLAVELLLTPVVTLTRAALPHLRAGGQGRIISIASITVHEPVPNLALSNAVRPGVWGYLKTLADEVAADGVTVNAVAPGRIFTARTRALFGAQPPASEIETIPLRRYGTPRELGDVVCFLASRQASYLTGIVVPVDGGLARSL